MFTKILKRTILRNLRFFSENQKKTIDFGFQQVDFSEKANLVKDLFNRAAKHYDLLNDVVSLGEHRSWKLHVARSLGNFNEIYQKRLTRTKNNHGKRYTKNEKTRNY